jgi:putative aldouronate transport system permease protein
MADLSVLPVHKHKAEKSPLLRDLKLHKYIYLMILPVAVWYFLFCYMPMYGLVIAFQDFNISKGVFGSPWIGLDNFKSFFSGVFAGRVTFNTVYLNIIGLIFGFPAPIIFALLLNEVGNKFFKKIFQTVSYLPFFISMVVICGIIRDFTAPDGIISYLLSVFTGYEAAQNMLNLPQFYRPIYIISDIWQNVGWSSIIYLCAISGINPELYEAAVIDGASRWKRAIHVTLPSISPTIIMLLILAFGGLMGSPLEKPLLLYNAATYSVSDVISTYIYRQGILVMEIGYGAAVGFFNSVINFIILLLVNKTSAKMSGSSLF